MIKSNKVKAAMTVSERITNLFHYLNGAAIAGEHAHIFLTGFWNTIGYKDSVRGQMRLIKSGLDELYLKGDAETLHEIKTRLVELMYFSFSSIHGGLDGILYSQEGNKTVTPAVLKEIDDMMRINRNLQTHIKALISIIDSYRFLVVMQPYQVGIPQTAKFDQIMCIEDAVVNKKALKDILDILILAELIDRETKYIKDKAKGNKGFFYSTIKLFFEKGYFKRRPTIDEYLNICNNTFNVGISLSTAKNEKTRKGSDLLIPAFIKSK